MCLPSVKFYLGCDGMTYGRHVKELNKRTVATDSKAGAVKG